MKFIKSTDDEQRFYQEQMSKLIQEYAVKDEEGNVQPTSNGNIKIQSDCIKECNQAIAELENTEVDIPAIKLKLSELAPFSMSIEDIMVLDEIIEGAE